MKSGFIKKLSAATIAAIMVIILAIALTACSSGKAYTATYTEEDTALHTVLGGVFTPGYGPTATTTVKLEIGKDTYKLTKTVDTTSAGIETMKERLGTNDVKPVHFVYTFEGAFTQNEDGTYLLSEATYATGMLDWGSFEGKVDGMENMPLTTSKEDETLLDWFGGAFVNASSNSEQTVRVNADGTFEFVEE